MNRLQLARRVGFAVVSVYAALSVTFAVVTFAPNTAVQGGVGSAAFANPDMTLAEIRELERTYRAARGLDRPLAVRYVDWLVSMTTLEWGLSYHLHAPVTDLVADRLRRTLGYALPGVVLAAAMGVAGGTYAALRRGTVRERTLRLGSYALLGVPNFWLAALLLAATGPAAAANAADPLPPVVVQRVFPALLLATTLFAGQVSYARAEVLEQFGQDYVRFLRAKGLGPLGVLRHVLRNAAVPLVTLFFTDLLAVFVVAVYVIEFAFDIPGFGHLTYVAARERDMPLLLGGALVVVLAGVLGNLFQDVAYGVLDPRTTEGER